MRYAVIENGVITNIVKASPEFAESQGWVQCEDERIGDLYQSDQFVPVPFKKPVPQKVSMCQARLALLELNLLDSVESAISSLPAGKAKKQMQIMWTHSATVTRDSRFIKAMAPALNLSETQIDELFILAGTL